MVLKMQAFLSWVNGKLQLRLNKKKYTNIASINRNSGDRLSEYGKSIWQDKMNWTRWSTSHYNHPITILHKTINPPHTHTHTHTHTHVVSGVWENYERERNRERALSCFTSFSSRLTRKHRTHIFVTFFCQLSFLSCKNLTRNVHYLFF